MTRGDRMLLAGLVLVAVLSLPVAAAMARPDAVVLRGPAGATHVDPSIDATYRIEGLTGEVVFTVNDGAVRCVSSNCPDQVCVHAGTVRPGAPVICAPNGVIAECDSSGEVGLDAVSR